MPPIDVSSDYARAFRSELQRVPPGEALVETMRGVMESKVVGEIPDAKLEGLLIDPKDSVLGQAAHVIVSSESGVPGRPREYYAISGKGAFAIEGGIAPAEKSMAPRDFRRPAKVTWGPRSNQTVNYQVIALFDPFGHGVSFAEGRGSKPGGVAVLYTGFLKPEQGLRESFEKLSVEDQRLILGLLRVGLK
jgi:hypothetical protein